MECQLRIVFLTLGRLNFMSEVLDPEQPCLVMLRRAGIGPFRFSIRH
jgi:hypothetical protein